MTRAFCSCVVAVFLYGCQGQIGELNNKPEVWQSPPPAEPLDCTTPSIGVSPLRRITASGYERTVQTLLKTDLAVRSDLPTDSQARGFDNQGDVQEATRDQVETWQRVAERLTDEVDETSLIDCDIAVPECFDVFLDEFGRRIFRRPLTDAQRQRYRDFFATTTAASSAPHALELVVRGMLMSPNFLYFAEDSADGETQLLDGYALAARLSFFLWNTTPDDALLDAAESGTLVTSEGLKAEALRLLGDPRARETIVDFYMQWLDANALATMAVPDGFDDSLRDSAHESVVRFVDDWYANGGQLGELLLSRSAFVDANMAAYYGLDETGEGFNQVTLPAETHGGLLTRAVFVATHTIPPTRGDFVLGRVLCSRIAVPVGAIPDPPEGAEYRTRRERFEAHADQACARGCHAILDPVGFPFEHYDTTGRWQAEDNGVPVNATTRIAFNDEQLSSLNGPIDGAMELSTRLAESEAFHDCHAALWFTYAHGRDPIDDACALQDLGDEFQRSGSVGALLLDIVQTDAFRSVHKEVDRGQP